MAIPVVEKIPIEIVRRVKIIENNEPLVEIEENERIVLLKEHKFLLPLLRKTVHEMFKDAAGRLPEGHKLLVVTAYRPLSMQKKLWRQRLLQMAKKHPFTALFRPRLFKSMASKYTALPGGSSHQCGAAIDVTVIGPDNKRLDMGTALTDFGNRCHTAYEHISAEQKKNREILYIAMTNAGLVNYPLEWWHYSYGDRNWAAYIGITECCYGPLEK